MSLSTRLRRPQQSDDPSSSSSPPPSSFYSKVDKQGKSDGGAAAKGFGWFFPLVALGMLSSQFALRSYLYILFHELVGRPASWLFAEEKVRVFYAVRIFLALLSVITDTVLVVALSRKYGKRLASYTLAMLCLTSGCFLASTSFLPSSFSMYAMSLSSGLFLLDKYAMSVTIAAVGVILGWPFSILAFLPVTFYSLARRFKQAFLAGAAISVALLVSHYWYFVLVDVQSIAYTCVIGTNRVKYFTLSYFFLIFFIMLMLIHGRSFLVSSVLVDHYYYSGWTSSLLNLLIYNVAGGGESHLYGTEGPLYYLRNGFNNFNFCFVLALLFLAMVPIARKKYAPNLLIVVSPVYIWLAFMSLQPHKEERFLYPIYPLICVAASAVIESFPDVFRSDYDSQGNSPTVMTAKILRPVVRSLILCASHARTFSVINGYSAPIEVYKLLEDHDDVGTGSVLCVGSEWHRFPSLFFVPDYVGEVRWIDDGFRGLLPFPFNSTLGGTAAAPPYLNNKNKASDLQYLRDLDQCTFLVELQLSQPFPSRGSDLSTWEVIGALPYLDRELSPAKYRSFFIPYLWQHKNIFGMYKLLRRVPK